MPSCTTASSRGMRRSATRRGARRTCLTIGIWWCARTGKATFKWRPASRRESPINRVKGRPNGRPFRCREPGATGSHRRSAAGDCEQWTSAHKRQVVIPPARLTAAVLISVARSCPFNCLRVLTSTLAPVVAGPLRAYDAVQLAVRSCLAGGPASAPALHVGRRSADRGGSSRGAVGRQPQSAPLMMAFPPSPE